jgi:hypothetical protein
MKCDDFVYCHAQSEKKTEKERERVIGMIVKEKVCGVWCSFQDFEEVRPANRVG